MSVPGFTDLGGGGGVKTPDELIAAQMGFTEDEQGDAFVPAPPPPAPAQPLVQAPVGYTEQEQGPAYEPAPAAYDPWTDELSSTTPGADYWTPAPEPAPSGVDYFGLDTSEAYQGDPNGPSINYVSDSEMFGLPEMGMQANGVDYFQMATSEPGSYLPDQVLGTQDLGLPSFGEIAAGLNNSTTILTQYGDRITAIIGQQDPNSDQLIPSPTSELGIAIATGNWALAQQLEDEYNRLITEAGPLIDAHNTVMSQYDALTSLRGEGPLQSVWEQGENGLERSGYLDAGTSALAGIYTDFDSIVGNLGVPSLQGGEGFGQLPQPVDVRARNQAAYELRDANYATTVQNRLEQDLAAHQNLITMEIYNNADAETQAEMRMVWTTQYLDTFNHPNSAERIMFGDTYTSGPRYFDPNDPTQRNLEGRQFDYEPIPGSDVLRQRPEFVQTDQRNRGSGRNVPDSILGVALGGAGFVAGSFWPKSIISAINPGIGGHIPDLSPANITSTVWKSGGNTVVSKLAEWSSYGGRTAYTLAQLAKPRPFVYTSSGGARYADRWSQPGESFSETWHRQYFDEYNALPFESKLFMESIFDPLGIFVVGPSVFAPIRILGKEAVAANRLRLADKAIAEFTARGVSDVEIGRFLDVTVGGGGSVWRTPREFRNVDSLARTFGSGLIQADIVRVAPLEAQQQLAHTIGLKIALNSVSDGFKTGFDKLTYDTYAYQAIKETRDFMVSNMGYTPEQAALAFNPDPTKIEQWANDVGVTVAIKRDPATDPVQIALQQQVEAVNAWQTNQFTLPGMRQANPLAQPSPLPTPKGFTPAPPRVAKPLPKLTPEQNTWLSQLHDNVRIAKRNLDIIKNDPIGQNFRLGRLEATMDQIAELAVKIHTSGAGDLATLLGGDQYDLADSFLAFQQVLHEYQILKGTMAVSARGRTATDPNYLAKLGDAYRRNDELEAMVAQFEERLTEIETKMREGVTQLREATSTEPVLPELKEAYQADISTGLLNEVERLSRAYGQNFWATIKAEGGGEITSKAALDWYQRFRKSEVKGATDWQLARLHDVYAALDGHSVDPLTPKGRWADQVEEIVANGTVSDVNNLLADIESGHAVPGRTPLRFTTADEYIAQGGPVLRKDGELFEGSRKQAGKEFEAQGYKKYDPKAPPTPAQLRMLQSASEVHQRDLIKELIDSPQINFTRADEIYNKQPITPSQRAMLEQVFRTGAIDKKTFDDFAKLDYKTFQARTDKGRRVTETGQVVFDKPDSILLRKPSSVQRAVNSVFLQGNWSYSEAELRQSLVTKIVDMFPNFTLDAKSMGLKYDPDIPKFAFGVGGEDDAILAITPSEFRAHIARTRVMSKKGFNSQWYARPIRELMDQPSFDPDSPTIVGKWQSLFQELTTYMTDDRVRLDELAKFSEFMAGAYKSAPEWVKAGPEIAPNPFRDKPIDSAVDQLSSAFTTWMAKGGRGNEYQRLWTNFRDEYVIEKKLITEAELPPNPSTKVEARQFLKDDLEKTHIDLEKRGVPAPGEGMQRDINALIIRNLTDESLVEFPDEWFADLFGAVDDDLDMPTAADPARLAEIDAGIDNLTSEQRKARAEKLAADLDVTVGAAPTKDVPWPEQAKFKSELIQQNETARIRERLLAQSRQAEAPVVHPDPTKTPAPMTMSAEAKGQRAFFMDQLRETSVQMGWKSDQLAAATRVTDMLAMRAVADGLIPNVDEFYKLGTPAKGLPGLYEGSIVVDPALSPDRFSGLYVRGVRGAETLGNTTALSIDPRPYIKVFRSPVARGDAGNAAENVATVLHETLHHFIDLMPDAQARALYEVAFGPTDETWTRALLHSADTKRDEVILTQFEEYLKLMGDPFALKTAYAKNPEGFKALEALRGVMRDLWQGVKPYLGLGNAPGNPTTEMRGYFDKVFGNFEVTDTGDLILRDPTPTLPAIGQPGPSRILEMRRNELIKSIEEYTALGNTREARRFRQALDETNDQIAQLVPDAQTAPPVAVSERAAPKTEAQKIAEANRWKKQNKQRVHIPGATALTGGDIAPVMKEFDEEIRRIYLAEEHIPSLQRMIQTHHDVKITPMGWVDWGTKKAVRWDMWTKQTQVTRVMDMIALTLQPVVAEAMSEHVGQEIEFILGELRRGAEAKDFSHFTDRIPGSVDGQYFQEAIKTLSRHLADTGDKDVPNLLGKAERFFAHHSPTKMVVELMPDRVGSTTAYRDTDLARFDQIMTGTSREAGWDDDQWDAVKLMREKLADEWQQTKGQFAGDKPGTWKKSVPIQEIDSALGTLNVWDPTDAGRFVENMVTYIGGREAVRIGYDPDTIPFPLKMMMAVKNQMTPFWLTFSMAYHVNNMVGNLAGWMFSNVRNDVNSPMFRRMATYNRVKHQLASGAQHPYITAVGSYDVRMLDGAPTLVKKDSLKARMLDPEKQGFSPATETRTLKREIASQLGKGERQGNRWFEKSIWNNTPGRAVTGLANFGSSWGEQWFREMIYGHAWEWTYHRSWAGKITDLTDLGLADNVAKDLRKAAGYQEVADVLNLHNVTGDLRDAVVSAQRKTLADASYDGYHATKTALRDYRMRNRLDGVLDMAFPIHFWTQKNALMVGQTFAQRPGLIPPVLALYEEHRARREDMPSYLREGYVGEIDLSSVLGDRAPAPFHLRLANITNPALFVIPKLLDRSRWDISRDAGALEILTSIGTQLPGNLYSAFGMRIGPHLDALGRVQQAILGSNIPGIGDRAARLSDFLATPNGYKGELFPYQFAAAGWAGSIPFVGDDLQQVLFALDMPVAESGFTKKEWLYKVNPVVADLSTSKGWTAEYATSVLAAMHGNLDEIPAPSWLESTAEIEQWKTQLQSDADLARAEVYRREAARSVKSRIAIPALGGSPESIGIYHDTGMLKTIELRDQFYAELDKAVDTVGRQAAIERFNTQYMQDKAGMDTWMPLFEAWLSEGRYFGGLFTDPEESLARVKSGDLSDPLFLLFATYAEGEVARNSEVVTNKAGKKQYKWTTWGDRELIALDRAYEATNDWMSTARGVSYDHVYEKMMGKPDENGEHALSNVDLLVALSAADSFPKIRDAILRNQNSVEYDQQTANRNRIHDLKSAEFDKTKRIKDEVYAPWAPYFEEREAIEERYAGCITGAGGSMAGEHACNAAYGREIGAYGDKTKALVASGDLPDIGDVSKLYPSFPYSAEFSDLAIDLRTPEGELYGKERAANEFKKRVFFELSQSEQQHILDLAAADDQRGKMIDRLLEDAGVSRFNSEGNWKTDYVIKVDYDEDGVVDYEEFNWDAYHADVAAAVEGGLGVQYKQWMADILHETNVNGGNFYVHLNPQFAELTVEDALFHTRDKQATVDAWWKEGKDAVGAWYDARTANDDYDSPIAEAERIAITKQYGPSIWANRDLSAGGVVDTQYKEGIAAVNDIYYSMTPADQAEWRDRYPDLFVEVENEPDSKNPGLTHWAFTKENLTTAMMTEILHDHGYAWTVPIQDPDAPTGWTMNDQMQDERTHEIGRVNEATTVEAYTDQAVTVVLNEEEQLRLQTWKDYTSNPLEAGAQNLLDSVGYYKTKAGVEGKSWGRVEEAIATQMATLDPSSEEYGNLNAMYDYVQRRRALAEEVNVGELYDKQAAWFATLDPDLQETLVRENPGLFERMANPEDFGTSSGNSSTSSSSSSGSSSSNSGSSTRTSSGSTSRTSSGRSTGGSAPRTSTGSSARGSGDPITSGSQRVLPALVSLDPSIGDEPERMVYASAVADWFDKAIFPLIQLAPQGKWRDWMSWLTMAGVAMVRTRLGKTPTLETWKLLAEELGTIDLARLDEVLAQAGAPEEIVDAADQLTPENPGHVAGGLPMGGGAAGSVAGGLPNYGYAAD